MVRSRLGSPSDAMQGATSTAAVPAPTSNGLPPSQPQSQPPLPNGLHSQQVDSSSHPANGAQEASQAAALDAQQDEHMQGTSPPPANGFVEGIALAMATVLPSQAMNGGSQKAVAGTGAEANGFSGQKSPADADRADVRNGNVTAEDAQSSSPSKDLKRMSWMEPDSTTAADWQVIGQADGLANGEADRQVDGQANGQAEERVGGQANGHINGQINGQENEQVNGKASEQSIGTSSPEDGEGATAALREHVFNYVGMHRKLPHVFSLCYPLGSHQRTSPTPLLNLHAYPCASDHSKNTTNGLMQHRSCVSVFVLISIFMQSGKMFRGYKRLGQHRLRSLTWTLNMTMPPPVPRLPPSGCHLVSTSRPPCLLCHFTSLSTCLLNSRR